MKEACQSVYNNSYFSALNMQIGDFLFTAVLCRACLIKSFVGSRIAPEQMTRSVSSALVLFQWINPSIQVKLTTKK